MIRISAIVFLANVCIFSNCGQIERKIFPVKYDLTVTPYFESETESSFEGKLVFTFKPLRHHSTSTLELHAEGLDIHSFAILEDDNNVIKQLSASIDYDSELQLLHFDLGYPLSVDNNYELHINYSGRITDDGWGLYKGTYDDDKQKRWYVVSQLRPVFARRLLPCLDEPAYKARFTLRVWRLPHFNSVSNMPLIDTSPLSLVTGRVLDTFAETLPMSTFLLALAVFDFASLTSPDKRFSTWTVPSKIHLANHGQQMIHAVVQAMEAVVGSQFPLPKMDQVALPRLNPVAMENWGMNTYREGFLLYEEGSFPPRGRQDVPRFTAHEVTHHWLGNLVTLQWWDSLWLSEMYAMYYEYDLPSQIEPSWRMVDQMIVDLYIPGMLEDSFNTTKPLTTNVSTNQEILAKFTGVTYTKGPALVHMINNFMTRPRAAEAIRMLIRDKKYGSVTPRELWRTYDVKAVGLPADMGTIMGSWTDQAGYPLVTAIVDQADGSVTLHQERFVVEGTPSGSALWWVPLTYTSGARPNFTHLHTRLWLTQKDPVTSIRLGPRVDSWLLFNIQHVGFYRVNYDHENWNRLIHALLSNPASIHELNRAQLLDDSFSLARAGRLSYSLPFRLASYLDHEGCYFPWAAVIPSFNFLLTRLNGHAVIDTFKEYLKELVSPVYDSLGLYLRSSDSQLQQLNRVQIVGLACSLGLPACVQAAQHQEQLISQGKSSQVAPGLESIQLCTVLEAGVSAGDKLHQLTTWSPEDQLRAMPCSHDKQLLARYLTKSLHEDNATDWSAKLTAAVSRTANINTAFSLLLSHYKTLLTRFGATNVAAYIKQVGNLLSTKSQLTKMESLQSVIVEEEITSAVKTVTTGLLDRLQWAEKNTPTIESWLVSFHKESRRNERPGSLVYCV